MAITTKKNDVFIILIVAILAFIRPPVLTTILASMPGKALFIILLVYATFHSTALGIALVFLFVYITENVVEGLTPYKNPILNDEKYKTRCKTKTIDGSSVMSFYDTSGNNIMTESEVKVEFPSFKYTGANCNMCDEKCEFSITP